MVLERRVHAERESIKGKNGIDESVSQSKDSSLLDASHTQVGKVMEIHLILQKQVESPLIFDWNVLKGGTKA